MFLETLGGQYFGFLPVRHRNQNGSVQLGLAIVSKESDRLQ